MITAAVAASDDEHHVLLSMGPDGTRVTLAHDPGRPGMGLGHHHCLLATVLTAFAAPVSGESDHVLSFPEGLEFRGIRDRGIGCTELGRAPERAFVSLEPGFGSKRGLQWAPPSPKVGLIPGLESWTTVMRC